MSAAAPSPPSLAGRAALVTGAGRGLGLAIARAFVLAGADVALCGRDGAALAAAREELRSLAPPHRRVEIVTGDASDRAAVARMVATAGECLERLSILVNNAGVQGPLGRFWEVDLDGWLATIATNLVGSALFIREMIPWFERAGSGKVVQLSGGGATAPMEGHSAYAASKAGVVRLAETLAIELAPLHVDVNALAPGALNTGMLDEVLAAGPERVGESRYAQARFQQAHGGASLERAAELAVWLASPASDGITGKLLSAVWDPWQRLAEHRDELASDLYTLRRIVPADRGLSWGEVEGPGAGR